MTDEEKQAIDKLKTLIQYLSVWKENFTIVPEDVKYLIPILNLIEKQSKLIDKLYKSLEDEIGTIVNLGILVDENAREKRDVSKYIDEVQLFLNTLNYNYISKDKIKAMLENEIINISGFECVAKEDVQSLLEKE